MDVFGRGSALSDAGGCLRERIFTQEVFLHGGIPPPCCGCGSFRCCRLQKLRDQESVSKHLFIYFFILFFLQVTLTAGAYHNLTIP